MKRTVLITYLIGFHILLAVVLLKTDFIDRVQSKFGFVEFSAEITPHFDRMMKYHRNIDGSVPDGSVIFIGDSITQGLCVSAVANPSVNYGIGSDTTQGVIQRLPEYKSLKRASVVILAIGINDMPRRSNDDILKNFHSILALLPSATPVVISGILPIDTDVKAKPDRNERIKSLNSDLEELAKKQENVVFVNAGNLLTDSSGNLSDKYHTSDGVHLNSSGNDVWIRVLKSGVEEAQRRTPTN